MYVVSLAKVPRAPRTVSLHKSRKPAGRVSLIKLTKAPKRAAR
ncbi:hypothetical protein TIN4_88 [Tsukamurella phage TIN4]|uniref:Uncharacterized protein n=2 Tax=Tinduovirus TIN3 TaxID=1982571 RepID=A0A0K0N649_9CAUD|nr:hypothetical protein AVT54_gp037 [Tsukamurella phage TIN3]YP_009604218.1 hypothetical protein FDH87_gp037 [Tsukamurella phage TIN4]AKJ71885.1 hypothetical protein TIN3_88 [Tsukamurella phage TIN3]AKJ71994.1 hypothetical protein TIN4_88 [Tsukamurella phage TIN4]